MKQLFILLMICVSSKILYAQNKLSFEQVETSTYNFYLTAQWDSLLIVGDEAINENIDYFYIRSRMGYAAYMKNEFRRAVNHFEKAMKFNANDDFVKYHLYLSYFYGGFTEEATFFGRNLSDSLKNQLLIIKPQFASSIYLEVGHGFKDGNENNILKNQNNLPPSPINPPKIYSKTANNGLQYFTFGLSHQLFKSLSLFHTLTIFNADKIDIFSLPNKQIFPSKVKITQYYATFNLRITKRLQFSPFIHLAKINQDFYYPVINPLNPIRIGQSNEQLTDYTTGASLFHYSKHGVFSLGTSYNHFSNYNYIQPNINYIWYPLKNNNLYSKTQIQQVILLSDTAKSKNLIISETLGFKIYSKLWTELFVIQGNITNSQQNNGFLLCNGVDNYKRMFGATLFWHSKVNLFVRYQFSQMKSNIMKYQNAEIQVYQTKPYNKQTIVGGILWKF